MTSLVYKYGLLRPIDGLPIIREQLWLGHVYRNQLTHIEHGKRWALRVANAAYDDIRELEAAVVAAKEAEELAVRKLKTEKSATAYAKKQNQPGGVKTGATEAKAARRPTSRASADGVSSAESKAEVKAARIARKAATKALYNRRYEMRNDSKLVAEEERITNVAHELKKNARHYCGLYWGTYLIIEAAADASHKDLKLYKKDGITPNNPKFRKWDGEGRISVQIQKHKGDEPFLSKNLTDADDTRVQICPAVQLKTRAGKSRKIPVGGAVLRMRVGSDEHRDPVWASWPMVMHRPLPEGAIIKRATVSKRTYGPREEWAVEFSLEVESRAEKPMGHGSIALDIGWRLMEGGALRVAVWRDDMGATGELQLDAHLLDGFRKAESLRSIRDKNFDAARDALVEWIKQRQLNALQVETRAMATWFADTTKSIHQWKSAARLASLARKWKTNRFDGDAKAYEALEAWRYHDEHLWAWEASQRQKTLRHRKDIYRNFAAKMGARYETVVFEQFDLSVMAERPKPEDAAENETARWNRFAASLSELRNVTVNAFAARGGHEKKVNAAYTTQICAAVIDGRTCGSVEKWDQAKDIEHTCSVCGTRFDQDHNAAVNILGRGEGVDPEAPAIAESKWVRAKRMAAEKKKRRGGGGGENGQSGEGEADAAE